MMTKLNWGAICEFIFWSKYSLKYLCTHWSIYVLIEISNIPLYWIVISQGPIVYANSLVQDSGNPIVDELAVPQSCT